MSCTDFCPLEAVPFDPLSPGTIQDDEVLYRSGFAEHFGAKNSLKSKAINNKELLAHDSLSFWRAFAETPEQIADAEHKLRVNTPPDKALSKKLTPSAKAIRDLRSLEGDRLFCVIDDVRTDHLLGKDALHAGVRLCQSLQPIDAFDPIYVNARDSLLELLEHQQKDLTP